MVLLKLTNGFNALLATMPKKIQIPPELLRRSARNKSNSNKEALTNDRMMIDLTGPNDVEVIGLDEDDHDYKNIKPKIKRHKSSSTKEPKNITKQESPNLINKVDVPQLSYDLNGYLKVDEDELDLERTLLGGQSFRWTKNVKNKNAKGEAETIFTGVVGSEVLQLWRCDAERVAYRKLNHQEGIQSDKELLMFLEDYFHLQHKLKDLYKQWSAKDDNLQKCCKHYRGFRILRQDPVENVFSFICATCNNIKRISQMIDKMCQKFGQRLEVTNVTSTKNESSLNKNTMINNEKQQERPFYYSFPNVERLVEPDVFDCLRHELGFGYRAKFIVETAKQMIHLTKWNKMDTPRDYLLSLRSMPYKETCRMLQQFPGIGRKVSDCICLMSMDHLNAIPVDCHIYEIFCRNYKPNLRQERKSLTEAVHDLIGNYFTQLHGPLAGWSTSVLFIAELKHLKAPKTVDNLLEQNWSKEKKSKKLNQNKRTKELAD